MLVMAYDNHDQVRRMISQSALSDQPSAIALTFADSGFLLLDSGFLLLTLTPCGYGQNYQEFSGKMHGKIDFTATRTL